MPQDVAAAGLPTVFPAAERREHAKRKTRHAQLGGLRAGGVCYSCDAAGPCINHYANGPRPAARQAPDTMGSHISAMMTDLHSQSPDVAV